MTSKISMHKKISSGKNMAPSFPTLLWEDLRRRSWLVALSLLSSFLAGPVAFLYYNNGLARRALYLPDSFYVDAYQRITTESIAVYHRDDLNMYLGSGHLIWQTVLLYACALLAACVGFHYLYSRRMSDLCHSAPVSRDRRFLVSWLGGFLTWFAPFLLGNLCVYALTLYKIGLPSYWGEVTVTLLKTMLQCVLYFLIIYNACLVPVMASGNLMNALVGILAYGLTVFGGVFIFLIYLNHYFDTALISSETMLINPLVAWLSPFVAPVYLILPAVGDTTLPNRGLFIALALASLAGNFLLAGFLHRRRPSELAERGMENKWFRALLSFAVSLLAGLLLAAFFESTYSTAGWVFFGAAFGSVLAFALMNIICHVGFKFLFCHKAQILLCALLTCGTVGVFRYDLIGFNRYLPKESEITGVSLYGNMICHESFYRDSMSRDRQSAMPSEDFIYTDPAVIHHLLETLISPRETSRNGEYTSINVRVYTTHGSYLRQYLVENSAEHLEALRPILESPEYLARFYPISNADFPQPDTINLEAWNNTSVTIEDSGRIRELLEAYRQDFLERAHDPASRLQYSQLCLSCRYAKNNIAPGDRYKKYTDSYYNTWIPLYFGEDYKRTMALLETWYPEHLWAVSNLEPTELMVSVSGATDAKSSLYRRLGVTNPAGENDLEIYDDNKRYIAPDSYFFDYRDGLTRFTPYDNSWVKTVSDPAELEQWKPYLVLNPECSFFDETEYVQLGVVTLSLGNGETFNARCYVKKGSLPSELLEGLEYRY